MKKIILMMALTLAVCLPVLAADDPGGQPAGPEIKYKVNLVMDDGTAIFYAGAKQGVKVGDEFAVYRGTQQVGTLKVTKVNDLASYGKASSGDVKEMDGLAPSSKSVSGPKKVEKTEEDIAKEQAKKDAAEKKKKEDAEKKKKADEEKAKKKKEEDEKKKAEAAKKPEPPAKKPEPPAKAPKRESADDYTSPTYYGVGGLLFMPTAQTAATKMNLYLNDVKQDTYTDRGFGLAYNMDNMVELSYTRTKTSPDILLGYALFGPPVTMSLKTDVISAKYVFPKKGQQGGKGRAMKLPGTKKKVSAGTGEIRYAVGVINYKLTGTVNGLWMASYSESLSATRYYVVGTSDYDNMKVHAGIYTQSGSLLTGTTDDGFGFMAGLEYPLGGSGGGMMSGLSLVAEYDDKAFYTESMRTPSVGLRYSGGQYSVTLGMVDVTQDKIMTLGGSYGF